MQSWDKMTCQRKCEPTKYMDTTKVPPVCEFKPKCANKTHFREEANGDCITCPAGKQPDADQRACVTTNTIKFYVDKHTCIKKTTIGDIKETDTTIQESKCAD
jgi:hypothetical protein